MLSKPCPKREELYRLIRESTERVKAMSAEEREAMFKAQRDGYVRAEMSWPKPRFKWVDGVKVYESYEDYVNG